MQQNTILLADMNSFYASVEQASDPALLGKPVLVAGDPERRHGIILAASREAKKYGVKTAMTLGDALLRCPQAIVVRPRMQHYIDVAMTIREIAQRLTDRVEVYSVDEIFLDVSHTEKLHGSPVDAAKKLRRTIREETGVPCSVGISYNKLMAKMCCDIEAKHAPDGVVVWGKEDVETKLHPLPVREMFMVGSRMERNFFGMAIRTIGHLAHTPVIRLKKRFGIMGQVYHDLAWGIDLSPVSPNTLHKDIKSIGHSMTLPRDYSNLEDIEVVLLELTQEVTRRARLKGVEGKTIHVYVANWDRTLGFSRQCSMDCPSNMDEPIFAAVRRHFRKFWQGSPVRAVGMSLANLTPEGPQQLTLFEDVVRRRALYRALDEIHDRFGKTAIVRASSLREAGLVWDRATKVGGHEA